MSRDPTVEFYHRESNAQRAEIASLRAELAAAKKEIDDLKPSLCSVYKAELQRIIKEDDALRAAARQDAEEIARLKEALEQSFCPNVVNDVRTTRSCVNLGYCHCKARVALASRPQGERSET